MALPNAKSFKANVAPRAVAVKNAITNAVGNVGKAIKEISYNITEPRKGKKADADRAAIKLARKTKELSFGDAVKNKMYDVANAKTDAARVKREVAKRKAKNKY